MSRYRLSPMAVQDGQSPMSESFRGYSADRGTSFENSASFADENTPGPNALRRGTDDAPIEPSEKIEVANPTAADLDQMADVAYELDPSGDVIIDSITVPDEPTPGTAIPKVKPKKAAPKKAAAKSKPSKTSRKPKS